MRIDYTSLFVSDQAKALDFYTNILGFVLKADVPTGGPYRWLTVVSADAPDGVQLVLEPNVNPAASTYQASLREQGIPATAFTVDDVTTEVDRLTALGVEFTLPTTTQPWGAQAIFDDTVGNLIQIQQVNG